MALVLPALPPLIRTFPELRPEEFPAGQGGWPLYFAPLAFAYLRAFSIWFLLSFAVDVALKK